MKTKILILMAVLLLSCSTESPTTELTETPNYGNISFSGNIVIPSQSSKIPVPECSTETPTAMVYKMVSSTGEIYLDEFPIVVTGEKFAINQNKAYPVDTYMVEEIYLKTPEGVITHATPSDIDPRFPFGQYIDKPLPYELIVEPESNKTEFVYTMCYTDKIMDFFALGFDGETSALGTLWFYAENSTCIDEVGIALDNLEEIRMVIMTDNPYGVPIPRNRGYNLNLYHQGFLVDTHRNEDGNDFSDRAVLVNEAYVYFLSNECGL